ncbi:hypothetical protein [Tuwongella immobilis]|uniref:hypothetical protein n=1 Tax=Tuwongella immobilis TaxID=692036 RepID=UPI0013A6CD37|nr:hypothetical protein [Tuwongella immobilis]
MDPKLFVLCLGLLVCLLPLAVYFLVLSVINSRRIPVLVHGSWDFAGLLMGLSGFVLLSGPILLAAMDSLWHSAWTRGDMFAMRQWFLEQGTLISAFWGSYYVATLAVIGGVIYHRRRVTVIYNVDLMQWTDGLHRAAAQLGRMVISRPDGYWIAANRARMESLQLAALPIGEEPLDDAVPVTASGAELETQPSRPNAVHVAESELPALTSTPAAFQLQVEPFHTARNLTIYWGTTPESDRQMLEHALVTAFDASEPEGNPASGLMLTAASCLFFLSLFSVVFLFSSLFLGGRR